MQLKSQGARHSGDSLTDHIILWPKATGHPPWLFVTCTKVTISTSKDTGLSLLRVAMWHAQHLNPR